VVMQGIGAPPPHRSLVGGAGVALGSMLKATLPAAPRSASTSCGRQASKRVGGEGVSADADSRRVRALSRSQRTWH